MSGRECCRQTVDLLQDDRSGNHVDSRAETWFTQDMTKNSSEYTFKEALWQALLLFKMFQWMGACE